MFDFSNFLLLYNLIEIIQSFSHLSIVIDERMMDESAMIHSHITTDDEGYIKLSKHGAKLTNEAWAELTTKNDTQSCYTSVKNLKCDESLTVETVKECIRCVVNGFNGQQATDATVSLDPVLDPKSETISDSLTAALATAVKPEMVFQPICHKIGDRTSFWSLVVVVLQARHDFQHVSYISIRRSNP